MAKSQELTVQESRELLLNPAYQEIKNFEMQQRKAQLFCASTIVPDTYRGNIGNCVIAIDMAQRMHANPLMVMQNLYIVHGNPAWSAKFLISCINMSGRFTPLRYQFAGKRGTKQYGCRAYAYEKADTAHKDALCSVWITLDMAEREGWTRKQGSKWLTMPDQMLIYRAAAFWCRAYAPEIAMGFLTKEEAEDVRDAEYIDIIEQPMAESSDIPAPPITDAPAQADDTDTDNTPAQQPQDSTATEPAAPAADTAPADAIAAAMNRQQATRKTNYRAPHTVTTQDGALFNPETGEVIDQ